MRTSAITGTSRPCAQSARDEWLNAHGVKFRSRLRMLPSTHPGNASHSAQMSPRRMSTMASTCSIITGHPARMPCRSYRPRVPARG
ncbi:MAG: hypothetical protein MZV64_49200 [Ignavibacteriales bacterium]|nr:hypothetical protein [Ignavibacteriales bacterium]